MYRVVDKILRHASPATMAWLSKRASPDAARKMALHHFRQIVRWAGARSKFYARAFAARGIDPARVRTPADLGDFYTTPDDIAACAEDFICAPPNIVFESSGTSGKNKQVYYSQFELGQIGISEAAGLMMMGLTPEDRVANAFDFSIWIPGMVTHYGLMAAGVFTQAFGKVDPVEVYRRLRQYRFTVVLGEPTWLIRLTELAEQNSRYPLKMLLGGAEEMPAEAVRWMEDVWKPAKVKMSYGSVELGGAMAFQPCGRADAYHLDNVNFLTETIDRDKDGYGEIVFTTLQRQVMPLIRYRTRDVARLIDGPCPCGLTLPLMSKLRGRRDELVVASGGNLYPLMFQNILERLPSLTHDWQVVFRLEGIREIMEIHVETPNGDGPALDAQVREQITAQYPDLMKNLMLGIFQMRVIPHPPKTLRTGRKLKRMVDRRHGIPEPAADDEPDEAEPETAHDA